MNLTLQTVKLKFLNQLLASFLLVSPAFCADDTSPHLESPATVENLSDLPLPGRLIMGDDRNGLSGCDYSGCFAENKKTSCNWQTEETEGRTVPPVTEYLINLSKTKKVLTGATKKISVRVELIVPPGRLR
ncbi:MAG: hypothetical protein Ct9H300mP23_09670 [Nitrospinota bacterium]|nr:MAG: hypothetical protein Ct9H300mP23_09670 [Nitrospinota bacterium]